MRGSSQYSYSIYNVGVLFLQYMYCNNVCFIVYIQNMFLGKNLTIYILRGYCLYTTVRYGIAELHNMHYLASICM